MKKWIVTCGWVLIAFLATTVLVAAVQKPTAPLPAPVSPVLPKYSDVDALQLQQYNLTAAFTAERIENMRKDAYQQWLEQDFKQRTVVRNLTQQLDKANADLQTLAQRLFKDADKAFKDVGLNPGDYQLDPDNRGFVKRPPQQQ